VNYSDLSGKNRSLCHWINFAAASLLAVALAGCGGGGGGGASSGASSDNTAGTATVNATTLTPDQFAALSPTVAVDSVKIASPPVVTFRILDATTGRPITGFGSTSKSATATVASYPNLAFSLAKLVPGVNGSPAKWVSYIVIRAATTTAAARAQSPSTDSTGTLVDNKDGTYTYTFFTDVKTVKTQIDGMTFTGNNRKADLGDLTFDPTALHRLTIVVSGNAPGTGSNTPDGVTLTPGILMANPVNLVYDFKPGALPSSIGTAVDPRDSTITQRIIVDKASCNECHAKLGGIPGTDSQGFHSGARYDPKYCVVCHTDQRRFGSANVVSVNNAFPAITRDPITKAVTSSSFSVGDGVALGDFPVLIHRIHKGELLIKKNYNFGGVLFNETKFPQDIRNCTKCHDDTAPKVAPQASNFRSRPSRLACGACHDGINFATGTGTRNDGTAGGHAGGPQADDSLCAGCHNDSTPIGSGNVHKPVIPPNPLNSMLVASSATGVVPVVTANNNTNAASLASNSNNKPAGAVTVTYDIKSVSRNASKQPVIVFRMLQNGQRVDLNGRPPPPVDPTKLTATEAATLSSSEIWPNFMGSPSAYFVWAVPQDGIQRPADFNASANAYLRSTWNGITPAATATMSGPDADGFYTVTLTGTTVPDSAVMLTGGVGYTYGLTTTMPLAQTNVVGYPVVNSLLTLNTATPKGPLTPGMPNKSGGLIVIAPDLQVAASGYTGRRAIVEDARCNKCHLELGAFTEESFHAGQRNDGTTCSWCHNPNRTSSGWSADSTTFIHAVHASDKRTKPFTWHASVVGESYADIGYPGILSRCETCHLPGTYDFSSVDSASALPNRPYRTVGTGKYNSTVAGSLAAFANSPYVVADNVRDYGAGYSVTAAGVITDAASTTLVNSPIAAACFACHDSSAAILHMEGTGGGSIYRTRGAPDFALNKAEQCTLCHRAGGVKDIKVVHPQ
jgi:OmcA/MtrC family decaheme c-type cytochrome